MKKIKLLFIALILLGSCKNIDFGDINKDPIGPNEPSPKDMLAGGIMNFFNNGGREYLSMPTLYIQWQTQNIYTSEMQYADAPIDWDPWYVQVLSNFKKNIEYIKDNRNSSIVKSMGDPDNQIGVNKIMMAYVFKFITDIYGDIPFSEALDPGNPTPKYENQIEIYHGIINMLKDARDMIDPGKGGIEGDIVYNGDVSKWQKLANSLIMHAALQLSKVQSEVSYATTEFNNALNHSAGVIEELDDEAWIHFTHMDRRMQNPYSRFRRDDYFLSKEFTDALQGEDKVNNPVTSCSPSYNHTQDYREYIFSNSPGDDGHNYSCSVDGDAVKMSLLIWDPDAPLPFFTASWVYLDRAEAAARGWTTENFDEMLTNGIVKSYESLASHYDPANLSVYQSLAATYAAARVADANNASYANASSAEDAKMHVIGEEKWVAYFPMGFEAWAQWRRIGYPELTPHPQPLNATGEIPRRYTYPASEATLNPQGYAAGKNDLTPAEDRNDSRVPWDVQ